MFARMLPGLIVAAAVIGVAACGSAATAGAGQPASAGTASSGTASPRGLAATAPASAGGSLCADKQGVDRVVVSRTSSTRAVTLSGATQVQALATALCALPAMPAGQSCPATSGSVRLVFAAGKQDFAPVIVQESGCRSVMGIGATTRSWSASSQVGQMIDEAVGGMGRLNPHTHPSSVPIGP